MNKNFSKTSEQNSADRKSSECRMSAFETVFSMQSLGGFSLLA